MPRSRFRIVKREYTYNDVLHTYYVPQHRWCFFFWASFEHYEGTTPMTTTFKTLSEAERFLREEEQGLQETTVKEFY